MSDEWTGLNVEEVTTNLENYKNEVDALLGDFSTTFQTFNFELYSYWASPKAEAFNAHLVKLAQAYNTTVNSLYEILFAAGLAASEMAKHNGTEFNNVYNTLPKDKLLTAYYSLKGEADGLQGMNIFRVNWAYDEFYEKISQINSRLENLPLGFGLYDPSGDIQRVYESLIKRTGEVVSEAINELITSIDEALQTETNDIRIGMEQAMGFLG